MLLDSTDGKTWYDTASNEPVFTVWEGAERHHNDKTKLYWFTFHDYQVELHGEELSRAHYPIRVFHFDKMVSMGLSALSRREIVNEVWLLQNSTRLKVALEDTYLRWARNGWKRTLAARLKEEFDANEVVQRPYPNPTW